MKQTHHPITTMSFPCDDQGGFCSPAENPQWRLPMAPTGKVRPPPLLPFTLGTCYNTMSPLQIGITLPRPTLQCAQAL